MEKFWKWLMKMDARGIFVISVVLLSAAVTWSVYTVARADDASAGALTPSVPSAPMAFSEYRPIGVIGFISNQFAVGTLAVPVNPFHPTFESIVRSHVAKGLSDPLKIYGREGQVVAPRGQAVGKPSEGDEGAFGDPSPWGRRGGGAGPSEQAADPRELLPPPDPTISFKGMLQRPDGRFAAYLLDSEEGAFFVVAGDKVRNAKVVSSGEDGVELEFPGGLRVALGLGDPPWVIGAEGLERSDER